MACNTAVGVESRAAAVKAAAWGTAVACGAGSGILVLPHTIKKTNPAVVDDSLGLYHPQTADNMQIAVSGDLPMYLRYDGLDLLIALAMGATGGAPTQQGATAAYAQEITLEDCIDGLFATLAINNNVNIDEYTSVKVTGFAIAGQVGQPVKITFHTLASDRITDSAVNTSVTFANVTFAEVSNRVLYKHLSARINTASGDALDSGDVVYPTAFELAYKRTMSGRYGVAGYATIDEPRNDGMPEVTLSLTFPRYSASAHFEAWDAGTAQKMDLTFTGGLIESTYYRTFKLTFPHLVYDEVDLPMAQGALEHPIKFRALGTATAPTGMTGILLPFQVDLVNTETADVLA